MVTPCCCGGRSLKLVAAEGKGHTRIENAEARLGIQTAVVRSPVLPLPSV